MSELGRIDDDGRLYCYCGSIMVARESEYGAFFGCERWPDCDGLVGCHKRTGDPLGLPAPKWVRTIRNEFHQEFDVLWKGLALRARAEAYQWLAEELGISRDECHIGRFDSEMCARAMEAIAKRRPREGIEEQAIEIRAEQERRRQRPVSTSMVDELPPDDDVPF